MVLDVKIYSAGKADYLSGTYLCQLMKDSGNIKYRKLDCDVRRVRTQGLPPDELVNVHNILPGYFYEIMFVIDNQMEDGGNQAEV